jgi:hypothetical protein
MQYFEEIFVAVIVHPVIDAQTIFFICEGRTERGYVLPQAIDFLLM